MVMRNKMVPLSATKGINRSCLYNVAASLVRIDTPFLTFLKSVVTYITAFVEQYFLSIEQVCMTDFCDDLLDFKFFRNKRSTITNALLKRAWSLYNIRLF